MSVPYVCLPYCILTILQLLYLPTPNTLRTFPSNDAFLRIFWPKSIHHDKGVKNMKKSLLGGFKLTSDHLKNSSWDSYLSMFLWKHLKLFWFWPFADRIKNGFQNNSTIHRCSRLTQGNFFMLWIMPRPPLNKILRELPLRVAIGDLVMVINIFFARHL